MLSWTTQVSLMKMDRYMKRSSEEYIAIYEFLRLCIRLDLITNYEMRVITKPMADSSNGYVALGKPYKR